MEALQNLDNVQFYDNVQKCYQQRRDLINQINNEISFKRPVPKEFYRQMINGFGYESFGLNGMLNEETLRHVVRQTFQQPGIPYYLQKYFARKRMLSE